MKKPTSPKPKFITDECVGQRIISFLRTLGFEVESVWDLGLKGATNGLLLKQAIKDKKVFLTEDHDFCNIILYPPHLHQGVIVLKTSPKVEKEVMAVLKTLLLELKPIDFAKTLIIVDKERYRIRRKSAE